MTGLSENADLYVYDVEGWISLYENGSSEKAGTENERVAFKENSNNTLNTIYFKVELKSGIETEYDLTITNDGSGYPHKDEANPWDLGTPDISIRSGFSYPDEGYYSVPVSQTQSYLITLTEFSKNNDFNLYVYFQSDFLGEEVSSINENTPDDAVYEEVVIRSSSLQSKDCDRLFIRVPLRNYPGGGSYRVSVKDIGSLSPEGYKTTPVDLGSETYSGTHQVAYRGSWTENRSSYYKITVTESTTYTISITGLTQNADLYVFESQFDFFSGKRVDSKETGTDDETAVYTTKAGMSTLYIQTVLQEGYETAYTLAVTK